MHLRVQREEMEGDASAVCTIEVSDDDEARERGGGNGGGARVRRPDVEATSGNGGGPRALPQAAGRRKEELPPSSSAQGEGNNAQARDNTRSFKKRKDQGWGELLDKRLVKSGDTICPPSLRENKGRRAVVQGDGTLLEDGVAVAWIDPVAFCVKNNDWRESDSFSKDRNRFLNCVRICAKSEKQEKLSDLKQVLSLSSLSLSLSLSCAQALSLSLSPAGLKDLFCTSSSSYSS